MKKALPNAIFVGTFGMTETAGTVTTSRLDATEKQRFTKLGTPLSGLEVKAMHPETSVEVGVGEKGEAWIRGFSTFTEYNKSPEKTAGFKIPRHVRFVEEWPIPSTKIQKFRLQDQLKEELGL